MNHKGFVAPLIIAISALVIAVVAGVVGYSLKSTPKPSPNPTPQTFQTQSTSTTSPSPTDETASWKTYKNDKWFYSFELPEDWSISASDQVTKDRGITYFHENLPVPPFTIDGAPIGVFISNEKFEDRVAREKNAFETQGYNIKVEDVVMDNAEKAVKITDLKSGLPMLFASKNGKTYSFAGGGGPTNEKLGINAVYKRMFTTFKFLD